MKRVLFVTILALTMFANCKKDDDSNDGGNTTITGDVTEGEAATVTGDIDGVGTVTVSFDETAISGALSLEIKKADSIISNYTTYDIEEAGAAVSILSVGASAVTVIGEFDVTLPLTLAITASLLEIEKKGENLAVLQTSGDTTKLIYPVTLSSDTKYVSFAALSFGTFQPIVIERANALIASNTPASLAPISSFTSQVDEYHSRYIGYNDTLVFAGYDATNAMELWKWDGTNAPTLIKNIKEDINGIAAGSFPSSFAVIGSKLFFSADDGTHNDEPWVYDGTTASLLKDINTSIYSSTTNPIEFNSKLYFAANDGTASNLWSYDGANAPTAGKSFGTVPAYSAFISPVIYDGKLFYSSDEGANSYIYSFDGTTHTQVVDINATLTDVEMRHLVVFESKLYFFAGSSGNNVELWVYDGSTTTKVSDVDATNAKRECDGAFVFQDKLFFFYGVSNGKSILWSYTSGGTPTKVFENVTVPNPVAEYAILGGKLYFSGYAAASGNELWVYDGVNTPQIVQDIYSGTESGVEHPYYYVFKNKLYFTGKDATNGYQVWQLVP